ncbi:plastocyanin/azurin family copper-binding protein [Halosegnis sp.]|uniref:plastocyanin/azurin family copper-binding protein n=1 Tax=Halosegnis sp. TaxID=2864959 RepID=UPI0035D44936
MLQTTRRQTLGILGTAGTAALAGCSGSGGDNPALVVEVGPADERRFAPAETTIAVGATVRWVWQSSGHTVTVDSQPDGASWQATGTTTHEEGHTIEHTFETVGTYDYYCQPHRGSGMVGTLNVGESSGAAGGSTPTEGGAY